MCSLKPPRSAAASSAPAPAGGSSSTPSSTGKNVSSDDIVATTWYAGWHSQYLGVDDISWDKYTSVTYAFAYVLSAYVSCPSDIRT